jgi:hypothetical protein
MVGCPGQSVEAGDGNLQIKKLHNPQVLQMSQAFASIPDRPLGCCQDKNLRPVRAPSAHAPYHNRIGLQMQPAQAATPQSAGAGVPVMLDPSQSVSRLNWSSRRLSIACSLEVAARRAQSAYSAHTPSS